LLQIVTKACTDPTQKLHQNSHQMRLLGKCNGETNNEYVLHLKFS